MKKRGILYILMCAVMVILLFPAAADAAGYDSKLAAASDAVKEKADESQAFEVEMKDFRAGLERSLKESGEALLKDFMSDKPEQQWIDEAENAVSGVDYNYDVTAKELHILTAEGMAWFAAGVDDGTLDEADVYLDADIDLDNKLWYGVGSNNSFKGRFDGQNHIVSNIHLDPDTGYGLFSHTEGTEDNHITIKNLTLNNVYGYSSNSVGLVVYEADYTDFNNINVTGDIVANGDVAGIAYYMDDEKSYAAVTNCHVGTENSRICTGYDFCGIVYEAYYGVIVSECSVKGKVYCKEEFNGIAEYLEYGSKIIDCSVQTDVWAIGDFYGIAYYMEYDTEEDIDYGRNEIKGCSFTGNVVSECDIYGGVVDYAYDGALISDCSVSGVFYSECDFWGIAEEIEDGSDVMNCSVSGKAYAEYGGAGFEYAYSAEDNPCEISGITVDLKALYTDEGTGLLHSAYGDITISDCNVDGAIFFEGYDEFGGIVSCAYSGYTTVKQIRYGRHMWSNTTMCLTESEAGYPAHSMSSSYHYGYYWTGGYEEAPSGEGNLTIKNCNVPAPVYLGKETDSICAGGILGSTYGSGKEMVSNICIDGCEVTGGIFSESDKVSFLGGITGNIDSASGDITLKNNTFTGNIYSCSSFNQARGFGGIVGADTSWRNEKTVLLNCNFNGDMVVVADCVDLSEFGGLVSCIDGNRIQVKGCGFDGDILVALTGDDYDGSSYQSSSIYHGGALFGGWKYPEYGSMENTTFDGSFTVLGTEKYGFEIDHFGMIVGEDCCDGHKLSNVTVNGDFYSDYAYADYFGGAVGHCCCNKELTASNVVINTNILMDHYGNGNNTYMAGFVAKPNDMLIATDCQHNGDITVNFAEDGEMHVIAGFAGHSANENIIKHCEHTGEITAAGGSIDKVSGFIAENPETTDLTITDTYSYGDILLTGMKYVGNASYWLGEGGRNFDNVITKNSYGVGNITIEAEECDGYVGAVFSSVESDSFTLDNFYYAGVISVECQSGNPVVGYIGGSLSGTDPELVNVYYDKALYEQSKLNGKSILFENDGNDDVFREGFMPLSKLQMQTNRYETDDSFEKMSASPYVLEPAWDYLNGDDYAKEIKYMTPLVDSLNAGKDAYLNWKVDGESFRGYPFFGQTWTILYYVDFGNGYELQNIEQFDKKGITAKEIPVPDQNKYPNSEYKWQDINGNTFTDKTRLFGDKMVYADLVSYYTVSYYANYPENPDITPSDEDIIENGYISGAAVTVRSNNSFTAPDGYVFKEWNTKADGSGSTAAAFSQKQIEDRNLEFYAIWEKQPDPTYSVYYVANGANGDMWDGTEYEPGDSVTVMGNEFVHPDGFKFEGFLEYETGTLYEEGDDFEISGDTYLIAQWKAPVQKYTVTYIANGAEGQMTDDSAYENGDTVTVLDNSFVKEGYIFDGFVDLDNKKYENGDTFTIEKDTVLIAQWAPKKHSVIYHGNGAAETDVIDSDYMSGTKVTVRDGEFTFTRDGYKFLYWSLSADGGKAYDAYDSFKIQNDVELYAVWEKEKSEEPDALKVTYNSGGGTGSVIDDAEYHKGDTVTVKPNGYTYKNAVFQGFLNMADGTVYKPGETFTITKDTILMAQWQTTPSGGGGTVEASGAVNILVVDSRDSDKYLPGAKIKLYDKSGDLIGIYTTDSNGQISVRDLKKGSYYAVECSPPEGYILNDKKNTFTISSGDTTKVLIKNERTGIPSVFTDDHYAYIIGYPDGNVHPEGEITRAEVATIFFRLLSDDVREKYWSTENDFSDVNSSMWCNNAISTMANMNIINGRSDGTFAPNEPITRAEFAAIAARFDNGGNETAAMFSDIQNHWAKKEISISANNGWINGYEDGTFRPDKKITRSEAMTLVNRVLQRIPESVSSLNKGMIAWPDNMDTGKWFYIAVQEATNSHYYERNEDGTENWISMRKVRNWAELEK